MKKRTVSVFPPGARVKVASGSKRYFATVREAFPEGSTSYLFPHYKVDFQGGDRNVAVRMDLVST